MNPLRKRDFTQLVNAIENSNNKMCSFRESRKKLVSIFVGSEGGHEGETRKVYLNLISLALNIYVRQLVVRAPSARITTPYEKLRPMAADFALACKDVAQETQLGITLRRAVTDAIFSPMATVKVGLELRGIKKLYDEDVDITEPFVKMVSFDDYFRDMSARSAYDPAFEGDTYYLTKEELFSFYPDAKGFLSRDGLSSDFSMQTESGFDRVESLSHSPIGGDDNWNSKIAVRDVWLTKEKLLVTYLPSKPEKAISVIEYDSREEGPYYSLWFTGVPDNAMGLSPFSVLKNIHEMANSLFRRLEAQAREQKRLAGFTDKESVAVFNAASDGSAIFYDGQKPENIQVGGIDPSNFGLLIQLKDMFSWAAGNLDSLGGLSPMSDTASQDKMLAQSASAQLADMQDAVALFAQKIFRQIAWYEWTDPIRERILQKEIPNTDISLPVVWNRETKQGDFLDFNFNINPTSMREDNPAQKVQKLQAVLTNVLLPLQSFMQMQGKTIDVDRFTKLIADYSGLPELEQLIISVDPNAVGGEDGPRGNPMPSTKPANTHRTYERINRPGATRVGKDIALVQTLFGGKVQKAESDAIFRGVS